MKNSPERRALRQGRQGRLARQPEQSNTGDSFLPPNFFKDQGKPRREGKEASGEKQV
jgi:hypothetical protein